MRALSLLSLPAKLQFGVMSGGIRPGRIFARRHLLFTQFPLILDRLDRCCGTTVGPFGVQALHGLLLAAGLPHGLLVGAFGLLFFPESRRPRLTSLYVAGAVRFPKIGTEQIHRDRKDYRGAVLAGDLRQRLEGAELRER